MSRWIMALVLAAWASLSVAQGEKPPLLVVTVGPSSYRVGDKAATTLEAVIADLRAVPKLEMVGVLADSGVPDKRVDEVVEAIRASGLRLRIGLVRNEVFTQ